MRSFLNFNLSVLTAVLILQSFSFSQEPGEPFHPMTAPGAIDVSRYYHILNWENPEPTYYNKVYFSDDYDLVNNLDTAALLLNGYPDSIYSSVPLNLYGYLDDYKNYYWRIVEYSNSDSSLGPIWYFTTKVAMSYTTEIFSDDFEGDLSNWTITNHGGVCNWEQYFFPYPGFYALPNSNQTGVFAADADNCGSGTTINSSARISIDLNATIPAGTGLYLKFDNDFHVYDEDDEGIIEISEDQGLTWTLVWHMIGVDVRESQEEVYYYIANTPETKFDVRFRSIQPGWDWWWAIDNVKLFTLGALTPNNPSEYLSAEEVNIPRLQTNLEWLPGSGPDSITSYRIERKEGLPFDSTEYIQIAEVDETVLSYIDTAVVKDQAYTYRVRAMHFIFSGAYSNEATAYIPDFTTSLSSENEQLKEFHLSQNYPNPFNPITTIKYQIPDQSASGGRNDLLVSLKVYDILGNEVATLVNESKPAGSYEVEFPCHSCESRNLSSGLYFYRISSGEYSETKKMILLK